MRLPKGTLTALYQTFVEGPLRVVGRPVYQSIIPVELAVHRFLYSQQAKEQSQYLELVNQHLTAIIKTFERPKILKRLVDSIKAKYPDMQIVVADDSRHPQPLAGVETVKLSYDQGVSVGRNAALERVKTKYILQLDDDFVFYHHTKLGEALAILDGNSQIDIMGGEVIDLPFFTAVDYSEMQVFPTGAEAEIPAGSFIAGLPVYDMVAQFFLGRTNQVKRVGWDPNLSRLDHSDFFSRAKGTLITVFNKDLKILHARTPYDSPYMAIRTDDNIDRAVLLYRYEQLKNQRNNKADKASK